jgi:hypothetical protein
MRFSTFFDSVDLKYRIFISVFGGFKTEQIKK